MRAICIILCMALVLVCGCKAGQQPKPHGQLLYVNGEFFYVEQGKPAPWLPQGRQPRSW